MAHSGKTVVTQAGAVGQHSFLVEEQVAFSEHLNNCLGQDEYLKSAGVMPLNPQDGSLYAAVSDGILLSKLMNLAQKDAVDERALNFPAAGKKLNPWELHENQNIVLNTARGLGLTVINLGSSDLIDCRGKEYLVLGLIWQMVKLQLLSQISIREIPELVRLLEPGEELASLVKLPPEQVLQRWINYHLEKQGSARRVTNLSSDLKDGEVYLTVLNSLGGDKCPKDARARADPLERARAIIDNAKALDVPTFIQPGDIVSGNKRLNLAFAAQIFDTHHGLESKEEDAKMVEEAYEAAGLTEEDESDAREERVFRTWLNSLNLGGGESSIHSLRDDLNDGIALLQALQAVHPGCVEDKKVNWDRSKLNRFKKIENCNYAVQVGKGLAFSLPGLGGVDIASGNLKLILGFVWQLMRLEVTSLLKSTGAKDSEIVDWANRTVAEAGKSTKIDSFKDASLANGLFLLDLLSCVEPRAINPAIPTTGETEEDRAKNAKYAISVARKIGAKVFLTWEDIRDVKPKMMMVFIAGIKLAAMSKAAAGGAGGAAAGGAGGK